MNLMKRIKEQGVDVKDMTDDSITLLNLIPSEEWERVMNSDSSMEIDFECLTCLNYVPFRELIPRHWTVVDFGCSYNPQAYLFTGHARHIAVDLSNEPYKEHGYVLERFMPDSCEFYEMDGLEFLESDTCHQLDKNTTFAICGYVPSKKLVAAVRFYFPNCFIYYPAGNMEEIQEKKKEEAGKIREKVAELGYYKKEDEEAIGNIMVGLSGRSNE